MRLKRGLSQCVIGVAFCVAAASPVAADEALVARGEYLSKIMDCTGCHTTGALAGQPQAEGHLAGSDIGFHIPGLGIFYPPNLTSDVETGLGAWSADEIGRAITEGVRPDGRQLVPIMPWPSYSAIAPEDLKALVAYLQSLAPVAHAAPAPATPETAEAPYLTVVIPAN